MRSGRSPSHTIIKKIRPSFLAAGRPFAAPVKSAAINHNAAAEEAKMRRFSLIGFERWCRVSSYSSGEVLDEPIAGGATRLLEHSNISVEMAALQNHQPFGFERAVIDSEGLVGDREVVTVSDQHQ